MINNNTKLKSLVKERTGLISSDCDTFVHVRFQGPKLLKEWTTGGGNFLMTIGLLAVINFQAKVYRYLTDPDAFVKSSDVINVKDVIKIIKKGSPNLKNILEGSNTKWVPPRVGNVNETECFIKLVQALLRDSIDLGLPADGNILRSIWEKYRNYITHMAYPKSAISTYPHIKAKDLRIAKQRIVDKGTTAFRFEKNGEVILNVDRLNEDVLKISVWLINLIDNADPSNVKLTLEWVNE